MAQLAIAAAVSAGSSALASAAGIAAGSTFLGMTAGGWGWAVGSMIGGMLLAPDTEGPRIQDRKVMSNTYGNPIPWVYGVIRTGTQVLWSSELIEHAHEEGGKGGGDVTMYSYSVNVLVSVCEAPAVPLRIWANGKLIWTADGRLGTTDEEVIQRGNVRQLLGDEDQMPDPVYEAAMGVGNVPAYRGQLCIMFEGLQLQFAGNRLPSIEVEVSAAVKIFTCEDNPYTIVSPDRYQSVFAGTDSLWGQGQTCTAYDPELGRFFVLDNSNSSGEFDYNNLLVYRMSGGAEPTLEYSIPIATKGATAGMGISPSGVLWVLVGDKDPGQSMRPVASMTDVNTLETWGSWAVMQFWVEYPCGMLHSWVTVPGGTNDEGGTGAPYGAMIHYLPGGDISWSWQSAGFATSSYMALGAGDGVYRTCDRAVPVGAREGVAKSTHAGALGVGDTIYIPEGGEEADWFGGRNYRIFWVGGRIDCIDGSVSSMPILASGGASEFGGLARCATVFSQRRRRVYIWYGTKLMTVNLDIDTGNPYALDNAWANTFRGYEDDQNWVESALVTDFTPDTVTWSEYSNAMLLIKTEVLGSYIGLFDPDADEWVYPPCYVEDEVWPGFLAHGKICGIKEIGDGWFAGVTALSQKVVRFRVPGARINGGPAILGDIVEDLCVRSGLAAEQLDVSTLTDLVDGFKVARRAAARASIDELRSAWPFDGVTSGEAIKFVKRGGEPVATLDPGELGARLFSNESEPTPALKFERPARDEVPRELSLTYIDASADYDPGVATVRRHSGGAPTTATAELAIVLSPEYAGKVAWYNLLSQHAASDKVSWALSHEYETLEPTDSVWLPMADGAFKRALITNKVSARPLVEFEGVFESAEIYGVLLTAPERLQPPLQIAPRPLSRVKLVILDLPPLRDVDDTLLFYAAIGPADGGPWRGATLYKSSDAGLTYTSVFAADTAAVIGVAETALPQWTGGNVFDDVNTLVVTLDSGSLESVSEFALLNGANAAALDGEIIQFQTATLVGDRRWELSRLLRGRRGTERAQGNHLFGGIFVLLDPATLRLVPYDYAEVGATSYFKVGAPGTTLAELSATTVVAQGNSVKPLSPVRIAGTRVGDDLTITWIRRARINAEWRDSVDVPLDEPSESYEVDILNGAAVLRTLTASSPSVGYSAAQQITDFGSAQAQVSVAVYQISSRIHRGHVGAATI